ncbi:RipA family octameric membrane protein [Roseitranquillus sediminis]|uniref:RipA family octameric membrane protein n=1 Tax=Roseitranquillus sediminis TaxID=2809051 RepID=UPI001D0C49A7|nr:hypothetical protein [Roseitranquillus sediminis]MBM9594298.1 hypothetical protein [Roseitranquillus sediminis]
MAEEPKDSKAPEQLVAFYAEDYKSKVAYLVGQFDRMWTRFNLFLTLETAIFAGFGAAFLQAPQLAQVVSLAGAAVSLLWLFTANEDRNLVKLYRGHVRQAFDALKTSLGTRSATIDSAYCHVGDKSPAPGTEGQRRSGLFTITQMPRWAAGTLLVLWLLAAYFASLRLNS